jgi:hypothetical protein
MVKNFIKITTTNILILLTFVFFAELFFGYWFDKDNLGPFMREHRMKNQKIEYEFGGKKEIYFYRRNYHGFRGKDIHPSEIKAIFLGPSTIEQKYEPERFTITGFLNSNFKKEGLNLEIVNAGVEAQSTKGMIMGFKNWLFKLENFSPKIILLYVGSNDHSLQGDRNNESSINEGNLLNSNTIEQFMDNIKSRSIILDSIRIFKFKYLPRKRFVKYDGNQDLELKKSFNYKSYKKATEEFDLTQLKIMNEKIINSYLTRIDELNSLSAELNSIPIFVTNITSGGYGAKDYVFNSSLMEHCKKMNYRCIDVAKKLKINLSYWKDSIHTTNAGSKAIAEIIFYDLKKIISELN